MYQSGRPIRAARLGRGGRAPFQERATTQVTTSGAEAGTSEVIATTSSSPSSPGGFDGLGLSPEILKAVVDTGYTTPTPIQAQGIPMVLQRRDLIGIAQTGTGKTASFTLPMIEMLSRGRAKARMPRALVLGAHPRIGRPGGGKLRPLQQIFQAQPCASDRRRLDGRPDQEARPRRGCADRHARPAARSFRARPPHAVPGQYPGDRRSRPHAGHGLHPGRGAHLQASALHPPDPVLFRHHAAGDPAADRPVPAQSRPDRSVASRHHRRQHHPGAGGDSRQ